MVSQVDAASTTEAITPMYFTVHMLPNTTTANVAYVKKDKPAHKIYSARSGFRFYIKPVVV